MLVTMVDAPRCHCGSVRMCLIERSWAARWCVLHAMTCTVEVWRSFLNNGDRNRCHVCCSGRRPLWGLKQA